MNYILSLFSILWVTLSIAQVQEEVLPPNYIKSIIFNGNTNISGNPIIQLGDPIFLEFDDIIGDEANYYYTIEHFNYDWTPSDLLKSEYLTGFDNVRITKLSD